MLMNKKQRLAVVLLVIAVVLLVTTLVVEFSIASVENSIEERPLETSGSGVGKVSLEIVVPGRESDGGG